MNSQIQLLDDYLDSYEEQISLYNYIRFYAPNIVSDIRGAFSFLTSELSSNEKISILKDCHIVKENLERSRSHIKGSTYTNADIINTFKKYDTYTILSSRKDILDIYYAVCGISFNGEELSCNQKARYAIKQLTEIGEPKEVLWETLSNLRLFNSTEYAAGEIAISQEDHIQKKALLENVLGLLKRNRDYWRDAICALYYDESCNDIELENKYIYYEFTRCIRLFENDFSVCIIDPSPFFIRKWMTDSSISYIKTDFIIANENILTLLTSVYEDTPNIRFVSMNEFDSSIKLGPASATLLFGTHLLNDELKAATITKLIEAAREKHQLYILDSDKSIFKAGASTHNALKNISINQLDLLPDDIIGATVPKRKTLLRGWYGYISTNDEDTFSIYRHKTEKNGRNQSLSANISLAKASLKSFITDDTKYRALFEEAVKNELTKTDAKRSPANNLQISEELRISYTVFDQSNGKARIRAYASLLDKSKNIFIPLPESTCERRNIDISCITAWINKEYLYSLKRLKTGDMVAIRDIISAGIRKLYSGKSLSLMSFIYAYPEAEEEMTDAKVSDIRFITDLDIGCLQIGMISPELLKYYLEDAYYNGNLKCSLMSVVRTLKDLFDLAISNGHCRFNPVDNLFIQNKDRYEELDEVTDALGKHFLTLLEIKSIIKGCKEKITAGKNKYIAVILRLCTGLEANIISALQWQDFITYTNADGEILYKLRIERQVGKSGKRLEPFKRKEQIRNFPIIEPLADILIAQKQKFLADNPGITKEAFMHTAIIEGEIVIDLFTKIKEPARINKLCRDIIKNLNIEENYIPLPDNKYGISDTDLNEFRGDVFKNSFRHYLLRIADPPQGEINYLLGIQAPNVDYGNYIDCSSDRKQSAMNEFLQKLWNLYNGEN